MNRYFCRKKIFPAVSYNLRIDISFQKQLPRGVLRNFAKFTGKRLCKSLFFNKVSGLRPKQGLRPNFKQVNTDQKFSALL